jgi:hypothetical protein
MMMRRNELRPTLLADLYCKLNIVRIDLSETNL